MPPTAKAVNSFLHSVLTETSHYSASTFEAFEGTSLPTAGYNWESLI